jgi:hypothetical protein
VIRPEGEVLWRKYPCFCEKCQQLDWVECLNKDLVGEMKVVVGSGEDITH